MVRDVRGVLGSILALIGAAAAVWSPFRAWYDGRHGSAYRIDDLFSGISADKAEVAGSMLLPFAFAALVTLVGLVLRSRALVIVAGLVVLGFTVLWMVRQGQAAGSLTVDSSGKGLGQGVGLALGGGLVMLLGAALMASRRGGGAAGAAGVAGGAPGERGYPAGHRARHGRRGPGPEGLREEGGREEGLREGPPPGEPDPGGPPPDAPPSPPGAPHR
ncbi:hypothetical protein ACFYN0_33045 [Streptomyces sp. NPDC006704]|uniref:hypothetical protein n=1 Tax=Streptomyces sp. NPDC006704 TaxID=3364760 RepID=UPI0036BBF87E